MHYMQDSKEKETKADQDYQGRPSPETMMHSPLFQISSLFPKIFQTPQKFLPTFFYSSTANFDFTPYFRCFSTFPPYFEKIIVFPTFQNFPLISSNLRVFTCIMCFLFPPLL